MDGDHRLRLPDLRDAIAADRTAGRQPFCVVGAAGTVNTGAIDDLAAMADLCRDERLWFHVDAAFGGLAVLVPEIAPRLAGMERADSLAFDFHKWLHVPYEAGCILIRDEAVHRAAFALRPDYLAAAERGLAGGNPWLCEYGVDLSRGFRALKVWFTLQTFGLDRLGQAIAGNCDQARWLAARVAAEPELELLAPGVAQHRLLSLSATRPPTRSTASMPRSWSSCTSAASLHPPPPRSRAGSRSAPACATTAPRSATWKRFWPGSLPSGGLSAGRAGRVRSPPPPRR